MVEGKAANLFKESVNGLRASLRMPAPPDDEPLTAGDAEAIAHARGELHAGMVVSHDEILREFGIR